MDDKLKWNDPKEKQPKQYEKVFIKLKDGSYAIGVFKVYLKEWHADDRRVGFINDSEVIGWINPEDIE